MVQATKVNREIVNLLAIFIVLTTVLNFNVLSINSTTNRNSSQQNITNNSISLSNIVKSTPVKSTTGITSLISLSRSKKDSLTTKNDPLDVPYHLSTPKPSVELGVANNDYSINLNNQNMLPAEPTNLQSIQTMNTVVTSPLSINGNAQLAVNSTSGSGTLSNPYIIGNYTISISSSPAISIQNTDAYFILQNNILTCTNSNGNGIYLNNVTNGLLQSNTVSNFTVGIQLTNSNNNVILDNNASYNNGAGIYLLSSKNNNISSNYFENDGNFGIQLTTSIMNTVDNNILYKNTDGLYIDSSNSNNITRNTATYNSLYGIIIQYSASYLNNLTNNVCNNNANYGIVVYQSNNNNLTQNTANYNSYAGIWFDQSNFTQLKSNFFDYNYQDGIYFGSNNHNNTLTSNQAYNNTIYGIQLTANNNYNNLTGNNANFNLNSGIAVESSNHIILIGNTANNNVKNGIILTSSSFNTVTSNTASYNAINGITLITSSNNNTVFANNANYDLIGGYNLTSSNYDRILNNYAQYDGNTTVPEGYGILIQSSNYNYIYGNIQTSTIYNIEALNSAYNTFYKNTGTFSTYGIYFSGSSHNVVTFNNMGTPMGSNAYPLYFTSNSNYNTVKYNSAIYGGYAGIYVASSSYNLISGNDATQNSYDGIYAYKDSFDVFYNNTVGSNYKHGMNFDSITSDIISYNHANSVTTPSQLLYSNQFMSAGIYVTGYSNNFTITNNDATGNYNGYALANEASGIIGDCSCYNYTFANNIAIGSVNYNIFLSSNSASNADANHILNNTALGNGVTSYGMYLQGVDYSIIKGNTLNGNSIDLESDSNQNSVVTNNVIGTNGYSGTGYNFFNSLYCNVVNNTISYNSNGLYVYYYNSYNIFANNSISHTKEPIFLDSTSTNNQFVTNVINSYVSNGGTVILNSPTNGAIYANSATLIYDLNLPATSNTMTVYVDGVADPLTNGSIIGPLSQGSHNVSLHDTDSNGNIFTQFATFSITDTLAPTISIISPLNTTYNTELLAMNYSVSDPDLFNITLKEDGSVVATYASGTIRSFTNGTHTFTVIGLDSLGNKASLTVSFSINLISVTFISPVNNSILNSVTVNYSGFGYNSVKMFIDNVQNTTSIYNPGFTLTGLADGLHNITIEVSNTTLNLVVVKSLYFTLDTTNPSITISSPINNTWFSSSAVVLAYSVTDLHLKSVIIYQNGLPNGSTILSGAQLTLTNGLNNITIYAMDQAGNIQIVSLFISIDTTHPVVTITSPVNNTGYKSVTLDYNIIETNLNYTIIYVNGQVNGSVMPSGSNLTLQDGNYNITIVAVDLAGNSNSQTIIFYVDTTSPTLTLINPTNTTYSSNSILISYSVSDSDLIYVSLYINGIQQVVTNSGSKYTLSNGYYNITLLAVDSAGNTKSVSVFFTVNVSSPTGTTTTTLPSSIISSSSTPSGATSSKGSSISSSTNNHSSKGGSSPGFELLEFLVAIFSLIPFFIIRRRKTNR